MMKEETGYISVNSLLVLKNFTFAQRIGNINLYLCVQTCVYKSEYDHLSATRFCASADEARFLCKHCRAVVAEFNCCNHSNHHYHLLGLCLLCYILYGP